MSTILIIDDSAELLDLYHIALRGPGHELVFASDGSEALRTMADRVPDLILLDLAMPGLDGLAFLQAVRATPAWHGVPVIVASAFGGARDVEHTRQLGVTTHLHKASFTVKELRAQVAACLGSGNVATA